MASKHDIADGSRALLAPGGESIEAADRYRNAFVRGGSMILMIGPAVAAVGLAAIGQGFRAVLAAPVAVVGYLTWRLLREGRIDAGYRVAVYGSWFFALVSVAVVNGVDGPVISGIAVILLLAGWLTGPRSVIALTAATLVVLFALAYAQWAGWPLPIRVDATPFYSAAVHSCVMLGAGLLGFYAAKTLGAQLDGLRAAHSLLSDSVAKLAQREHELRAQTERLEIGQRTARMIVMDWDIARDELTWSDSPEWLRGPLPGSGRYPLYKDQVHADDRAQFLAKRAEGIETMRKDDLEYRLVRTDGKIIWVYSQRAVLPGPHGKAARMLVALHDITERKEAQLALQRGLTTLRESEERFRGLTELFASYFWEIDADLRFTMVHGPGLKDLGLRPEDLLGRRSRDVSARWSLVSPSLAEFDALRAQRRPYHDILSRFTMPDGSHRYLSIWGQPRFAEDGRFLGYRGVTQDVTARITLEQEVRQLNETLERRVAERTVELEQANKELESFSYSVSHDLRAPLRAIAGFSAIVRKDYGSALPEPAQKRLQRVEQNALEMGKLIDNLLELARIGRASLARSSVDMRALAGEVAREIVQQAGVAVRIDIGDLPPAIGDPILLRQVWRNLLGNAVKFSRNVEAPSVEVGFADSNLGAAYYVRDNGVGFDMQLAGKLFGAFQRLHAPTEFEGTGIGLATVKRIIERHGGRIDAESAPARGATFRFTLA